MNENFILYIPEYMSSNSTALLGCCLNPNILILPTSRKRKFKKKINYSKVDGIVDKMFGSQI